MGIFSFLDPIIDPLVAIVEAIVGIVKLVILFLEHIPNIIEGAAQVFDLNKLLNDIISGIFVSFTVVFEAVISMFSPRKTLKDNNPNKKNTSTGIFGFSKPTKNGKNINPINSNDRKCFPPTLARLILMIICPPFALFTHVGLRRWYYIVICALLTVYGYYFPGLLYAALHILC